ncbi:NADP-dependent isocitrate dehydrogenase [Pseudanabaena cinerea]|uniref:NADP-dependent isocitrate dehydrogenase n=1 Tax=Pseudanabaena cinerea TaxID=2661616 RepID=UPI0018EFE180|nr:NADP-dependent isocitrate dehydrogenase [Pseudanabaena cinerea]
MKQYQRKEGQFLLKLSVAQGQFVDMSGYYGADCNADCNRASQAMRPSQTLNETVNLLQ